MRRNARRTRYRAVLFDLFGTLVFFKHAPTAGGGTPGPAQRYLRDALAHELPGVELDAFLGAMRTVSSAMNEERRESHREWPSQERFRRVLEHLETPTDAATVERLCLAHMRGLAESTELPDGHREVVQALAARFQVGLVSNFDHAATAREILARYGLAEFLDPVVISDEFGWRKPRREIFAHAVEALRASAQEVLFVGDTPLDDVHGAGGAGLDAAWINRRGEEFPAELLPPTLVVGSVIELRDVLLRR